MTFMECIQSCDSNTSQQISVDYFSFTAPPVMFDSCLNIAYVHVNGACHTMRAYSLRVTIPLLPQQN